MLYPIFLSMLLSQTGSAPQIQDRVLSLKDGTELRYAISVSRSPDQDQPLPLILALHYGWRGEATPDRYGRQFLSVLIEPAFRNLDCVLVAPDCPTSNWTNRSSETAVLELVAHIKANYPIDSSKLVVTGFSLGGFGTWYMGAQHPRMFSAVIPIAGRPRHEWLESAKDLNLFVIHSRQDEVVPIAPTESAVEEIKRKGSKVQFLIIDSLGHYETGRYVDYLKKGVAWLEQIWGRKQVGPGAPGF